MIETILMENFYSGMEDEETEDEMKIKQTSILGNCGTKICKVLLRHIGGATGENLEGGPETRRLLLDTLDQLLTPFRFR